MRTMLLIHVAGGGVGIVTGYLALFAPRGADLHRRAGVVFVGSMLTMALAGTWLAVGEAQLGNITAGLLTAYLVVTALTTMRPSTAASRRVERGAMIVALATGVASLSLALQSVLTGEGTRDGVPVVMYLLFGVIALLSGLSDLPVMRAGGVRGPRRLRRHLWRMCFALFIATGSFFLGQADEFPERLRVWPVLSVLAFAPLVLMVYWLWRVRARRMTTAIAGARAPGRPLRAAAPEPATR
ncbi:MAG TPA: DUF2306 domain-containing protein [Longimicrobium sp.]|nr:DUF2306 domain-containing protein [Longimicrobium sp.]